MKTNLKFISRLTIINCFIGIAYASTPLIIKFKPSTLTNYQSLTKQQLRTELMHPININLLSNLSIQAGVQLHDIKPVAIGGRVIETKEDLTPAELKQLIKKLENYPNVDYVEPDVRGQLASTPTPGLLNPLQWDMTSTAHFAGLTYYGNYFAGKNSGTTGTYVPSNYGAGVIVAVVDSGYTPHPDFINNLVPLIPGGNEHGYQFITTCGEAGTCTPTENQDTPILFMPDALDQGDGVVEQSNSEWHGTHIIGTIVGNGYNSITGTGVSGGAPAARILPVRVGGIITSGFTMNVWLSDVINGMMWAGGNHVDGAEDNNNPAKVMNLSLGAPISCSDSKSLEDAVNTLHSENINIVAAAMNNSQDTQNWAPANCPNVISVAATGPTQKLTSYSDYGNVTISAAGGDENYLDGQVYSTICNDQYHNVSCNHTNSSNFGWAYKTGTSMAAPHVCAAIAVLLSKNPNLTPDQIIDILQKSATPYLNGNNCNATGCITNGILNTEAAITSLSSFKH